MRYPVAERGSIDGYMGEVLPVVVVFDHEGKLILHKRRFDDRTREVILKALDVAPHPLLGGKPYVKLAREAELVQRGENLGLVLSKVRRIRAEEEEDLALWGEAYRLYSRLDYHAEDLFLEAELAAEKSPVLALRRYEAIGDAFKGDEIGDQAEEAAAALRNQEHFSREEAAWALWEGTAAIHAKHRLRISSMNRVMLEKADRLLEEYGGTAAARMAQALRPKLQEALGRYDSPRDVAATAPSIPDEEEPMERESLADFRYALLDGREFSLADHRGKIVVIDFFSAGWLLSRNNIVHMERIHRRYRDQGIVVLGFGRDEPEVLRTFVNERSEDMTYRVGRSPDAFRQLRVGYIPHVFIIDPEGRLYWHGEPRSRPRRLQKLWARIDERLENLLKIGSGPGNEDPDR